MLHECVGATTVMFGVSGRLGAVPAHWRSVATLMSGTLGAQAIGAISMLFLTRVYTPAEFGRYALFFAVANLLMLLATARYEQAVFVAKRSEESVQLTLLAIVLSGVAAVVVLILAAGMILFRIESPWTPVRYCLLGLVVASGGSLQALNALATQQQTYGRVSRSRLIQSIVAALVNSVLGVLGLGAEGLALGLFCGQLLACLMLLRGLEFRNSFDLTGLTAVARDYIQFPRYSLPGEFLNNVGNNLISFATPSLFGAAPLGQYNLGQRVAAVPLGVIGSAMGDVFRAGISPQRATPEMVTILFRRTTIRLATIGLMLTLPFFVAGPHIVALLFGEKWRDAGQYLQLLAPMMFARFVVSPLSATLLRAGRQKLDALLQVLFVVGAAVALAVGRLTDDFTAAVGTLAAIQTVLYGIFFYASFRSAKALSRL